MVGLALKGAGEGTPSLVSVTSGSVGPCIARIPSGVLGFKGVSVKIGLMLSLVSLISDISTIFQISQKDSFIAQIDFFFLVISLKCLG